MPYNLIFISMYYNKAITITTVEHFPPFTGVLSCFYHQVAVACNNQCSFSKTILSFKMMKFYLQLYVTMFMVWRDLSFYDHLRVVSSSVYKMVSLF